jgi:hypothetical protein
MLCLNRLVIFATISLIIASGIVAIPILVDDENSNVDGKGELISQIQS